ASDADVQTYLSTHNTIRSQHGAVPVTWSNAAAVKAQQWADECKNQHSGGTLGPLGENLAAGTGSFSITNAVKAWTDEVSEYNANDPQPSHFTQVVWKATTQIGCAVATCNGIFAGFGAAQYYVCEYSVQGNVIGNFGFVSFLSFWVKIGLTLIPGPMCRPDPWLMTLSSATVPSLTPLRVLRCFVQFIRDEQ
ncbi:CAP domain-containing protein, partial [Mycena rosella]